MKKVATILLGSFDTKGEDFGYLYSCLIEKGLEVITINLGVFDSHTSFPVRFGSEAVAQKGGTALNVLQKNGDRGQALEIMSTGAANIVRELYETMCIGGIIGMGGGGGTFMVLKVMKVLPFGIPKLCVSTLATKDLSAHIGPKDITLMPSIVDVAGLNSISKTVIRQAAGAICGMMDVDDRVDEVNKRRIAISVFGNTTLCVDTCSELLKSRQFDVLTFHSVGTGGQTMESLTRDGYFDAILDITTTELADELCGGICSAGPERLTAGSDRSIPQVVVPGCLDMVNFGPMDTVPVKYRERQLFNWAPDVTLMRTNPEENYILGQIIAEKLNKSRAPVTVLLPLGGLSKIGGIGKVFHNPAIDQVLFASIKDNVNDQIKVKEIDANINTPEFANEAVNALLELLEPITNNQ